jgi:hypothetical protein
MPSATKATSAPVFKDNRKVHPEKTVKKQSFCSKLELAARKTIHTLSCGALCEKPLNSSIVRKIKSFKETTIFEFQKKHVTRVVARAPEVVDLFADKEVLEELPEERFNESLEGMRTFAKEMALLAANSIKNIYIDPALRRFNTAAANIPDTLKALAKEFIGIGEKSKKPIFQLLEFLELGDEAENQASHILSWVLKDLEVDQNFKDDVLKRIRDDQEFAQEDEVHIAQNTDEQINYCINKLVHWLTSTDHKTSPLKIFENNPLKPSDALATQVFQTILNKISEEKIESYRLKAAEILENKLPGIIDTALINNTEAITDALTERIAEVFTKLGDEQFKVLFDKIVNIIAEHVTNVTKSYEEAAKLAKEQGELESFARNFLKYDSSLLNEKEQQDYKICQKYIENLDKFGSENSSPIVGVEEEAVIKIFLERSGKVLPSVDNSHFIAQMSEDLIKLLFPEVTKDGVVVDGLQNLFDKIFIPDELQDLLKEAEEISKMITSETAYDNVIEFVKTIHSSTRDVGILLCKEALKIGMNEGIGVLIKDMSKPEVLQSVVANSVLPNAAHVLMKNFADDLIQANLNHLAPLFKKLPEKQALIETILKMANSEMAEFDLSIPKNKEAFKNAIRDRVNEIERLLSSFPKVAEFDAKKIKQVINAYYETDTSAYPIDHLIEERLPSIAKKLYELDSTDSIIKYLMKIAKDNVEFKFLSPNNKETFDNFARPRIEQLAKHLADTKPKSLEEAVKKTTSYLKENNLYKENNPRFADFVEMALNTGEFGITLPTFFKFDFARNMASELITQSVHSMRKSYIPLFNMTIPVLDEKFKKKELMDKWVTKKPSLKSLQTEIQELENNLEKLRQQKEDEDDEDEIRKIEIKADKYRARLEEKKELKIFVEEVIQENAAELEKTKREFPDLVDTIARLSHDLLSHKAKQKAPFIGKFVLRKFANNSGQIKEVTLKLLNQITGHQAINEQLIGKILNVSIKGLGIVANSKADFPYPLLDPVIASALNGQGVPVSAISLKNKPYRVELPALKEPIPLWKRIINFIVNTFKSFVNCFKSKTRLNDSHKVSIKKLEDLLDKKMSSKAIDAPELKPKAAELKKVQPTTNENASNKKTQPNYIFKPDPVENLNASLLKVNNFVTEFVKKMGNIIYDVKIKPPTDFISEKVYNLPEYVKQCLNWISQIAEPAANSLFKYMGYDFGINETLQGFLAILMDELYDDEGDIKNKSLELIEENFKAINEDIGLEAEELEHYLIPLRKWMQQDYFEKTDIRPLSAFLDEYQKTNPDLVYNNDIVTKFYFASVRCLTTNKINASVVDLQDFLENKLAHLIKTHLDTNLQNIAQLLFNRVARIVNEVKDEDYKEEIFDVSARLFHRQLKIIAKAKDAVKEAVDAKLRNHEAYQLAKRENDKKQAGKISLSILREEIAKELKCVDHTGKPVYDLPPLASSLIVIDRKYQNENIEAYKQAEENKEFDSIVDQLLDIIFPSSINLDGLDIDVDGFYELCDSIHIEDEVKNKFDEMLQFFKSVLPAEFAGKMDEIIDESINLTKKFAVNVMKAGAKQQIAQSLKTNFKRLANPVELKDLMASNKNEVAYQLAITFAKQFVTGDAEKLKTFFKQLIEAGRTPLKRNNLIKDVQVFVQSKLKKSWAKLDITDEVFKQNYFDSIVYAMNTTVFSDYFIKNKNDPILFENLSLLILNPDNPLALQNISENVFDHIKANKFKEWKHQEMPLFFKEQVSSVLSALVHELKEAQKRMDPNEEGSELLVKQGIERFFIGENDNNPLYSELVGDLINLVQFGGGFVNGIFNWVNDNTDIIKSNMTKGMLPAMHPIRASVLNVTDLAAQFLKQQFLNDDYIKSLIVPQTLEELTKNEEILSRKKQEILNLKNNLRDEFRKRNISQIDYEAKIKDYNERISEIDAKKIDIDASLVKLRDEAAKAPERKAALEKEYDDLMSIMARLIYDFGYEKVPLWTTMAGNNKNYLRDEVLKKCFDEIFINSDLNLALPIEIMHQVLAVMEEKRKVLDNQHAVV